MTSDGLPHQVRAVISNAREDSTAVTWYELTRRREQRLAYVRAYGAYWQKGSGGGRAAVLEALESKMSLELCMRYRELTRAVGANLRGRWWEAPSWARAGAEEASSWALLLPPRTVASGAGAGAPPPENKGGFDWFGLFKPKEDEEDADGGGARGAGAAQRALSCAAASSGGAGNGSFPTAPLLSHSTGNGSAAPDDALRRQVRARGKVRVAQHTTGLLRGGDGDGVVGGNALHGTGGAQSPTVLAAGLLMPSTRGTRGHRRN